MKVVFAGPSIADIRLPMDGIVFRRPAQYGDIAQAVADDANVIGIIDGHFGQVASVWHKEILFALSEGVQVLGAASMGALRAAECEAFGMVPVGSIARRYCSGEICDDGDVALLNAPEELAFAALTEPMVNVDATAARLGSLGIASATEVRALSSYARSIFFWQRTVEAMFDTGSPVSRLADHYRRHHIDLKSRDAEALIAAVSELPDCRAEPPNDWQFAQSRFWAKRAEPITLQ